MKKIILVLLSLLLTGCSCSAKVDTSTEKPSTTLNADELESISIDDLEFEEPEFNKLSDEDLRQYVQDSVYASLENEFDSDDYIVDNVITSYVSKEYIEELEYNSQKNIWFGYSLDEIKEEFGDTPFVFTLNDNNETVVTKFSYYNDDTYNKMLKNVAIGAGVILIGVSISAITGATGAASIKCIVSCSAKKAYEVAKSSTLVAGMLKTITTSITTGNFDENAIKQGVLAATEGFKWGAIVGTAMGLREKYLSVTKEGTIRTAAESEKYASELFSGEKQISYLNGKEVPYGTPGATRPDLVDKSKKIAYEVKNYDISSKDNVNNLINELRRQVQDRVINLPSDYTQKILLDVGGRGYSTSQIDSVVKLIRSSLKDIYTNIPVEIMA